MHFKKTDREAVLTGVPDERRFTLVGVVDAPQPCEARACHSARRMEMEQFPGLCLHGRAWSTSELSGMAADHQLFPCAHPLIRTPRMSGAAGVFFPPNLH